MPTLTLKKDGLLVKWLTLTYRTASPFRPKSTCALFWLLLFSPLLIVPINVAIGIGKALIKIYEYIDQLRVDNYITYLKNNPVEFMRIVASGELGNGSTSTKYKAMHKLEDDPFYKATLRLAGIHDEDYFEYDQLGYIFHLEGRRKAINFVSTIDGNKRQAKKDSISRKFRATITKELERFFTDYKNSLILFALTSVFYTLATMPIWAGLDKTPSAIAIQDNFQFFWAITNITSFLVAISKNSGATKILYSFYRAFKDKTCPIIKWE